MPCARRNQLKERFLSMVRKWRHRYEKSGREKATPHNDCTEAFPIVFSDYFSVKVLHRLSLHTSQMNALPWLSSHLRKEHHSSDLQYLCLHMFLHSSLRHDNSIYLIRSQEILTSSTQPLACVYTMYVRCSTQPWGLCAVTT